MNKINGRTHNGLTINSINRKRDIFLKGEKVYVNRSESAAQDLGNKSWGILDFIRSLGMNIYLIKHDAEWRSVTKSSR